MLTDYRKMLREEYERRLARNSRFSIRSFAKFLKISPGHLSDVLNGKKLLSEQAGVNIALALGWDKRTQQIFRELVRLELAGTDSLREAIQENLKQLQKPAAAFAPIESHGMEPVSLSALLVFESFGLKNFQANYQ